jgi:hypothetical protein
MTLTLQHPNHTQHPHFEIHLSTKTEPNTGAALNKNGLEPSTQSGLVYVPKFTPKFYYAKRRFSSHQNTGTYMEY